MKVERKEVSIIEKAITKEYLDGQRWGLLIEPKQAEGLIELRIIFDLLVPVNINEYAFIKSGSLYHLHEIKMENLVRNMDFLETIVQQSMMHTRNMMRQVYPEHSDIEIELFDKAYFSKEISRQLKDLGLVKSPLKRMAVRFKVGIIDLPLIGVILAGTKNEIETTAFIKENDHKNYINSKSANNLGLEEIIPNTWRGEARINHRDSPVLILDFEIDDEETNDLYPIVIGTGSLASMGISSDFYLKEKEMVITIPLAEPISEN